MATSEEEICNMALGHIGHTQFIDDLETEQTAEVEVCNTYYKQARDFVLEAFPWPEATKYTVLGLVENDPNCDWKYSYRYPDDCIFARRIVTAMGRNDPNPPPFLSAADDTGRVIYTNQENAEIEYTKKLEDVTQFRPTLTMALSWYLGALICPGLARDKSQADRAMQMYVLVISQAHARALNEQQQTPEPDSEFIRARA
jgi:hypothetical protein